MVTFRNSVTFYLRRVKAILLYQHLAYGMWFPKLVSVLTCDEWFNFYEVFKIGFL